MHIADGCLSAPVLAGGAVLAAGGMAWGLRRMDLEHVPRAGLLASAFFVASLIHVPVGPSSAHLLLNGLVGLVLGPVAFPAILVALLLQAILFGHGGLTTLGVNTVIMAFPAVLVYGLLGRPIRRAGPKVAAAAGFAAGMLAVAFSAVLTAAALVLAERRFLEPAYLLLTVHAWVMLVEGAVTASLVTFLQRVRPELLNAQMMEKDHA